MAITLQKMAANTASLTIQVGEDSANITYYPGRVTDKILAQIQGLGDLTNDTALAGFGSFNASVASLIKSWDVYEDDEQTQLLPITAEGISALPFAFRVQLLDAIIGDIRPEGVAPQST